MPSRSSRDHPLASHGERDDLLARRLPHARSLDDADAARDRHRAQYPGRPAMSERFHDDRDDRERRSGARAGRGAQDAGRFSARDTRADRQPYRLRARHLRRLHGARRRRGRARLPDAGGAVRRRAGGYHRGRLGFRRDCRPAGGVREAQCPAMRLLHAGHAAHGAGTIARAATAEPEEIRDHISGNYCRCTGYQAIVDAIESVAQQRAGAAR